MANIQSAKKRARQNVMRRAHNMTLRSRMRTAMKRVLKAVASGDKEAARASFRAAVPAIDKLASKGVIRKNRAAHYKRRLSARVRDMNA